MCDCLYYMSVCDVRLSVMSVCDIYVSVPAGLCRHVELTERWLTLATTGHTSPHTPAATRATTITTITTTYLTEQTHVKRTGQLNFCLF